VHGCSFLRSIGRDLASSAAARTVAAGRLSLLVVLGVVGLFAGIVASTR
jgi:hypothetical protein